MMLIFNPLNIGEYVKNDQTILPTKVCPISHLPFNFEKYGEKPMNITNVSNKSFVVSEQGLYCWLNLQSEMEMQPADKNKENTNSSKKDGTTSNSNEIGSISAFLCPITMEPLRVMGTGGSMEAKSYLSSTDTSYHVFLM